MTDPSTLDDRALFARIAEGDEVAFEIFFHRYNAKLFPILSRLLEDDATAKEIMQESFLKMWRNRTTLAAIENPGGWIHTVAVNTAYNHQRGAAKKYIQHFYEGFPPTGHADEEVIERQLQSKEIRSAIEKALEQISPGRRKVFRLIKIEGLSRKQAAEQLGISELTVKNQLKSALELLREHLRDQGYGDLPVLLIVLLIS